MANQLGDGVRGCLLGGAIGDALGAPVENWHWRDIREQHGRVQEFLPQPARSRDGLPGQITDDSTLRQYLCTAIVEHGGRIGPEEYARTWLDKLNPARLFVTERMVHEKLRLGMSPWETGRGQLSADAAIMAIAPVGIINVGDPAQAYRDGFLLAGLHQDGLERDAAASVAAGTAVALMPAATAGDVVDAMASQASYQVRRLVGAGVDLADQTDGMDDLVERFYATMLDHTFPTPPGEEWHPERSVAATSREVLPAVVAILLACSEDPNEAIIEAAGVGRDADTIASVVGCLAGSLHGAGALRPGWVSAVESANADFFAELTGDPDRGFVAMADRMVRAIESERNTLQRRLDLLTGLLETNR